MSGVILTLAALAALASDPRCGAAVPGSEFASRLAAIAVHESGGDPLIIGVNPDSERYLPASVVRPSTTGEAIAAARALLAQGRSIDVGLMQINSAQLSHHGLSVEDAFDGCRSMSAGADHFAADVRAVWNLAHRRYNTGSIERGERYAAEVEQVLARVRSGIGPLPMPTGEVVVTPQPRSSPGLEDVLHATPLVQGDSEGLSDALHPVLTKETP